MVTKLSAWSAGLKAGDLVKFVQTSQDLGIVVKIVLVTNQLLATILLVKDEMLLLDGEPIAIIMYVPVYQLKCLKFD